jgi:hypothetical protein
VTFHIQNTYRLPIYSLTCEVLYARNGGNDVISSVESINIFIFVTIYGVREDRDRAAFHTSILILLCAIRSVKEKTFEYGGILARCCYAYGLG